MLVYPKIDPIIFSVGPLDIRWYSLAYLVGIVLGCFYVDWLNKRDPQVKNIKAIDNLLTWAILGIIVGGRLGYVFFYNLEYFLSRPEEIFMVWHGGMSFHGGMIGFIVSIYLFCNLKKYKFLTVMDLCAAAAPIGLFFGRIANFINGELYGRVSDAPWAMIFPEGGDLPRHPSQIYQALTEGLLLFLILFCVARFTNAKKHHGLISALFLIFYGSMRFMIENFREPDRQLGYIFSYLTMGQILCLPMIILGLIIGKFAIIKK